MSTIKKAPREALANAKPVGAGYCWEDLAVGQTFITPGRTMTETDLVNFITVTGMTEALFIDITAQDRAAIKGRVVPAALTYSIAEGLALGTMAQSTGLAFLGAKLDVNGPVFVGDTIRVLVEVTAIRPCKSNPNGIVTTRNDVINQRDEIVLSLDPSRMVAGREFLGLS